MRYLKQHYATDIETCLDRGGKLDAMACIGSATLYREDTGVRSAARETYRLPGAALARSLNGSEGSRLLPIGNFHAGTKVKYYSETNITMSSRLCDG